MMPLANREILSVSDLNRQVRNLLEGEFPHIFVDGELSNMSRPSSGHWYFTLKDDKAQIRCAMFRNRNRFINFKPVDGSQVIVNGKVSIYEGRGDFQLIVEQMEEAGDGALRRAFEQLKQKLHREGLFDDAHKSELPFLPQHVGVITSPSGAAISDILTVMRRRFPAIALTILPVQVQGDQAPDQIVAAIKTANLYTRNPFDLLLVTRGGGSLEDLWAFNSEKVARAIHASEIPVVSAVGHEVDFTIADFVADLRAATPSAAAELISPDQVEWRQMLAGYQNLLVSCMENQFGTMRRSLLSLSRRLRHPGQRLQDQAQRLDDLEIRLTHAAQNRIKQTQANVTLLASQLHNPAHLIAREKLVLQNLLQRLKSRLSQIIEARSRRLALTIQGLNTLSPLATLERGYAIISTTEPQPVILKSTASVAPGDKISARLHAGELIARVESVNAKTSNTIDQHSET
ncbi:MAG: exodeoxyribonuclease VII large subunit [Gammaproteobacteria bacterium]|nr:exodeoxyribonuclease VII large subunit [Gammaproteobacteria bacterium]